MNLVELFLERAKADPDGAAIVDTKRGRSRVTTFAALADASAEVAARLAHAGVSRGDAVVVLVPMTAELYATIIALWRLGAYAVFFAPSGGRAHIRACCDLVSPSALVGIAPVRWLALMHRALGRIPRRFLWDALPVFASRLSLSDAPQLIDAPRTHADAAANLAQVDDDHPAILTFTSGTTGAPKGAIRTHGLLNAQYGALLGALTLTPGERDLATLPVFALANLAAGVTTIIPNVDLGRPGFVDGAVLLDQVLAQRPTRSTASPALLLRLADAARARAVRLSSFTKLYTGGAPVFPRNLRAMQPQFPSAAITVVYGSTEAEPISHLRADAYTPSILAQLRDGAGLLVGRPVPQTRVRIIGDRAGAPIASVSADQLDAMTLPAMQPGEIIVAGRHVIPGYLGGLGDAENKIHCAGEVWHRTGDAGYLDADGALWLLGRCGARVTPEPAGADAFYPLAVEAAATEAFDVAMAACVAIDRGVTLVLPEGAAEISGARHVGGVTIDRVRVAAIPTDARHNAKVDYAALRRSLA